MTDGTVAQMVCLSDSERDEDTIAVYGARQSLRLERPPGRGGWAVSRATPESPWQPVSAAEQPAGSTSTDNFIDSVLRRDVPRATGEDGARAVELAREAVESYVLQGQREQPGSMRDAFYARTGAFVRLQSTRGRGQLRGCAGTRRTDDRLGHAIVDAAITAASGDSCGSEIEPAELSSLTVSVCVVCDTLITDDPLDDLELGTHGVTIDADDSHGWLYPTLPIENDWGEGEFLSRACRTDELPPLAWQSESTLVTLFEGQVFRERPDGSIEEL
jgi:uncharacterized protein (TIGR00296 family)